MVRATYPVVDSSFSDCSLNCAGYYGTYLTQEERHRAALLLFESWMECYKHLEEKPRLASQNSTKKTIHKEQDKLNKDFKCVFRTFNFLINFICYIFLRTKRIDTLKCRYFKICVNVSLILWFFCVRKGLTLWNVATLKYALMYHSFYDIASVDFKRNSGRKNLCFIALYNTSVLNEGTRTVICLFAVMS